MNLAKEVNKRRLAIFDFDGLMVNSEQVIYDALKKLFDKYRKNLTWDYFARHIGTPVDISLPQFHKDYSLPMLYDNFLIERNKVIKKAIESDLRLMPGLIPLLHYLKERSFKLSIATSAKRKYLENILTKYNIEHYFKYIVTIEEVKRGKPHPDLFLAALTQSNVSSQDAFILEDSPSGIQAAKEAGVMSIAIPTPGVDLSHFSEATFIIESLESLVKSLDKER